MLYVDLIIHNSTAHLKKYAGTYQGTYTKVVGNNEKKEILWDFRQMSHHIQEKLMHRDWH